MTQQGSDSKKPVAKITPDVIHVTPDLRSYFESEVIETGRKQGLAMSPPTAQYLGAVLSRFADAKNFFVRNDPNSEKQSFPVLATMFLESFGHSTVDQLFQLQHMGDVALFSSGFFQERIDRSLVDRDYFMAMGGMAYERAGRIKESMQVERALNVYFELSERFEGFAEVFAELADRQLISTDRDLLKLYEKWLRSGSARIARMLNENGVIASAGSAMAPKKPMGGEGKA